MLFFISLVLVLITTYLITSILSKKNSIYGFIYFPIIAFAQIVLQLEILSFFNAINTTGIIISNILFLIISSLIWIKKDKPLFSYDCKPFFNKVSNSFHLDKSLIVLFIGALILFSTAIFLGIFFPTANYDAQAYHIVRAMVFSQQESLNHFITADIRNVVLPINSEILYCWVHSLTKQTLGLGIFSILGLVLTYFSTFATMGLLGFSTRKKLWTIFIMSSFATVIAQICCVETDIIIAGLTTSGIFLFWSGLKSKDNTPIFISALAFALAIGTKTSSFFVLPAIGLFFIALAIHYNKKDFYKPLLKFAGFSLINFLIFASFNYILNFIQFGNFFTSHSFEVVSKNYYGFKGCIANCVKHFYLLIDFTGFKWSDYIETPLRTFQENTLAFLNIAGVPDGLYDKDIGAVNRSLVEPMMGCGILGFLAFLPCLFWALIKPIFSKSRKTITLAGFAIIYIISFITMSTLLCYMLYNVRFIMIFTLIAAPVLAYSYYGNKNPIKYIFVLFAMFYMVLVSTHLWSKPMVVILHELLINKTSINKVIDKGDCNEFRASGEMRNLVCDLRDLLTNVVDSKNKILFFANDSENILIVKRLVDKGYTIDLGIMEGVKPESFTDYNLVIVTTGGHTATIFKDINSDFKQELPYIKDEKYKYYMNNNDKDVPCAYITSSDELLAKDAPKINVSSYPFRIKCGMREKFMEKSNLKLIGYTKNDAGIYYSIYENTKKPMIKLN